MIDNKGHGKKKKSNDDAAGLYSNHQCNGDGDDGLKEYCVAIYLPMPRIAAFVVLTHFKNVFDPSTHSFEVKKIDPVCMEDESDEGFLFYAESKYPTYKTKKQFEQRIIEQFGILSSSMKCIC